MATQVTLDDGSKINKGHYQSASLADVAHAAQAQGPVQRIQLNFDHSDDIPGNDNVIPAGATILSAEAVYSETVATSASFDFGLDEYDSSGFSADTDALISGSTDPSAGATDTGAGAQIGQELTQDVVITLTKNGSPSAGAGELIVKYIVHD